MKFLNLVIFLLLTPLLYSQEIAVIPKPQSVKYNSDQSLNINQRSLIVVRQQELKPQADLLIQFIENNFGYRLNLENKVQKHYTSIILEIDPLLESQSQEGYQLNINQHDIIIKSKTSKGVFYGTQTLMQLLFNSFQQKTGKIKLPSIEVIDFPRFRYRGMHLDVARRFYSKEFIKKYIDVLALHKINTFHWHLTDDQGWRLEIKKYPKLTDVGGRRTETAYDKTPTHGWYTQKDVKEIINYANDRYITIIPEIEMPGHAMAALAAYPQYSCKEAPVTVATNWGIYPDVFCAGKENTFTFLEDILTEVMSLFPSEYIHIGGDEVLKERWQNCPHCQQRITDENLQNEEELQSYFIQRIQKFVNANGKKIIGWDEILEGGLAPNATVMSWRGESGGIAAAQKNHQVIMSPDSKLYFNYFQGDPNFEPNTIGKKLTLKEVYQYNPIPPSLEKEKQKYIIGAQACLWTERVANTNELEYMLLPRLSALAEVVWTSPNQKTFNNFAKRLKPHLQYLKALQYSPSYSYEDVTYSLDTLKNKAGYFVYLKTESMSDSIYYSINQPLDNANRILYTKPIKIAKNTTLKAKNIKSNHYQDQRIFNEAYNIHKAFRLPVKMKYPFMENYAGLPLGLTDGLIGSTSYGDGKWQGFLGDSFEGVIDFGHEILINTIQCHFLRFPEIYLFAPKYVKVLISDNGVDYKEINHQDFETTQNPLAKEVVSYQFKTTPLKARYLKVVAKNIEKAPSWHKTSGKPTRLFIDEIIVN